MAEPNAMQQMFLNMLVPRDQQEALKKVLSTENLKHWSSTVVTDYKTLKEQMARIEAQNIQILELLQNDRNSRGSAPIRIARANGSDVGSSERSGTDG